MFSKWPLGRNPSPASLQKLYEDGFPGCQVNLAEKELCYEQGIIAKAVDADELVQKNPGKGKSAFLWRSREKYDPGAFGEENQTTGDCVSHGDRNARDTVRSVEVHIKGELEEYFLRGATEPTYGARGHSSEGMDPYRASKFVTQNGYLLRQNYPGVVDLSKYNSRIGTGWGRSGVPQNVVNECKKHKVGQYIIPKNSDQAMALFFNGYACHSGQNIGFSNKPDSKGIHPRKGNWAHDMATLGYDDTRTIWDRRVYFVFNSWGEWNEQWVTWVQDVALQNLLGPPIDGVIVCDASVWEQYFLDDAMFYSDIEGIPIKGIPDYGTGAFL